MHVRISSGIFEGREGVVTDLRQSCKVVLALSGVEERFSLEMQLQDIEASTCPARISDGCSPQWTHSPSSVLCMGSSGKSGQVK
jgi:hypothetical protein